MAFPDLKQPQSRALLGGDLLAQCLARLGVKVAFGLHGGHLDAFLIGCDLAEISLVDTRHETVGVQAAEGYAKITAKVGVCFVTANSGFCNGLPGLATAFADRSPIFCITSSPPLRDAETNCLQGFHDQVVLAKPITKFAHRVTNVEEIPRIVSYAFRTAQLGIPGPVLVDFPIDVLFSPPRMSGISWGAIACEPAAPPAPDSSAVSQLLALWKSASRPVIITGTGASQTAKPGTKINPLIQLAEATATPIFYSSKYRPAIPNSHPLFGGRAVLLAALPMIKQPQPDLVILLGARTGFLLGGRSGAIIPDTAQCKLAQIDLDGAEIGKSLPVDLGIVSDTSLFISAALKALKDDDNNSNFTSRTVDNNDWLKTTSSLKTLPSPHESEPTTVSGPSDQTRLHPYHALSSVLTNLPQNSIVVIDGGESGVWALDLLDKAPDLSHALASTGYLGFLGNGWGYSLGCAIASREQGHPDRVIVNIQGDGSAGFHIAELDTFARHNLPVVTVVMNNQAWGMSVAGQDIIYGATEREGLRPATALSSACRFDVVARGFGIKEDRAVRVDKVEDVVRAVKDVTASGAGAGAGAGAGGSGPALIELLISRHPVTQTTKSMVGITDDEDVIVVPYYDNVPKPHYKEKTNGAA